MVEFKSTFWFQATCAFRKMCKIFVLINFVYPFLKLHSFAHNIFFTHSTCWIFVFRSDGRLKYGGSLFATPILLSQCSLNSLSIQQYFCRFKIIKIKSDLCLNSDLYFWSRPLVPSEGCAKYLFQSILFILFQKL